MTDRNPQEWRGKDASGERRVAIVVALGIVLLALILGATLAARFVGAFPSIFGNDNFSRLDQSPPVVVTLDPFTAPFTDVAQEAGVIHAQATGATGERFLPETMGSGIALADFDGDGRVDLLALSYGSTPRLYRNVTETDGAIRFDDATAQSGLGELRSTTTSAVGDIDGDGDLDLLVARLGPDVLFRNDGALRFTEVARLGDGWTSASGFIDVDGDSDLDLVIARYVEWSKPIDHAVNYTLDGTNRAYGPPTGFKATDLSLYINDGTGQFTDETSDRGLLVRRSDRESPVMKALGLLFEDVDNDQDIDILVANDTTPNRLFVNDGDGRFVESAAALQFAYDIHGNSTGAMGIDSAWASEYSVAIAIGNFSNEPTSYFTRWVYDSSFADTGTSARIGPATRQSLTFGTLFFDADMDGELDLLQVNGHIEPDIARLQAGQRYEQSAQLLRGANQQSVYIAAKPEELGDLGKPIVGRAAACADLDGDFDQDLVISRLDAPPLVLRNDLPETQRRISVRVRGAGGNTSAYGAYVDIHARGSTVQRQMISPTRSYMSQSDTTLLFGVAKKAIINRLVVRFQSGAEVSIEGPIGDHFEIVEPTIRP